jgi:hypothetical protein
MIAMESALALLSLSAPITVAIIKWVPRRVTTPSVVADIAAINATLKQLEKRMDAGFDSIQSDIRELRGRL